MTWADVGAIILVVVFGVLAGEIAILMRRYRRLMERMEHLNDEGERVVEELRSRYLDEDDEP